MVIADAVLVPSRRSRRLNPPDETFGNQNAERVVHRLQRDGTDLGPDRFGHGIRRDVGLPGYGAQDS